MTSSLMDAVSARSTSSITQSYGLGIKVDFLLPSERVIRSLGRILNGAENRMPLGGRTMPASALLEEKSCPSLNAVPRLADPLTFSLAERDSLDDVS
jgi:hypothetical protein